MPCLKLTTIFLFLTGVGASWTVCLGDTLPGEVRGGVVDIEGRVPLPETNVTLVNVDRGWKK